MTVNQPTLTNARSLNMQASDLGGRIDLQTVLNGLARALGEQLGASRVRILVNSDLLDTHLAEWAGRAVKRLGAVPPGDELQRIVGEIGESNEPLSVDSVATDARFSAEARRSLLASDGDYAYLSVPLLADERVLGAITVHHLSVPHVWSDAEIACATQSAMEASWAVRTAELGEREQRLTKLSQDTEPFRAAFLASPLGMAISTPEGRRIEVNDALCQLLGLSRYELLTGGIEEITHPEDRQVHLGSMSELLSKQSTKVTFEKRFVLGDGRNICAEICVTSVADDTGELVYFISQIRDVSEEKHAEVRRREGRSRANSALAREDLINGIGRRLREELELSAVQNRLVEELGTVLKADRVRVIMMNEDSSYPTAEWVAAGIESLGEVKLTAPLANLIRGRIDDGRTYVTHDVATDATLTEGQRGEQQALGVAAHITTALRGADEIVGLISVHQCTRRSWTEDEVELVKAVAREAGSALMHAQLYATERHAVERMRDIDQAKDAFFSSATHELRSPLTSIKGYTDLLLDGEVGALNSEQVQMLDVIRRNSGRLLGLIQDLLDLSRLETSSLLPSYERFSLIELTEEIVLSLEPLCRKQNVRIRVDNDEAPFVMADRAKLERALLNLVNNAVKFSSRNGLVTLRTRAYGEGVEIEVEDNGIGIPKSEHGQLFSRFFRASTAINARISGTGLGLTMVKSIVEAHNGTIEVDSVAGRGTRFVIRLPMCK